MMPRRPPCLVPGLLAAVLLTFPLATTVLAADIYVDPLLGRSSCTTYSPATRTCAAGSARAFVTLRDASDALQPGDTAWLRGATYNERLAPRRSGTPDRPIAYRAFPGEAPIISGASLDPAVDLSGRDHIEIDGLTVTDVIAWLRAENTHHTIVRNSTFLRATAPGTRAGLKYLRATFNQIRDNTLRDGNDNLMLIDSDRNIVEGNTLSRGRHALLAILCGNSNVIRSNRLENELQKLMQVTDCEGVPSDSPSRNDATKFNLIEGNDFGFTPSSGTRSPYAGIQYSAQQGIVRRNIFRGMTGPGIQMTLYNREARHNTDNRVYHNVFHGSRHAGVDIAGPGVSFGGNVFVNNTFEASTMRGYAAALEGLPIQILAERLDGYVFRHNNIVGGAAGGRGTVVYGDRNRGPLEDLRDLDWWHHSRPALYSGNLELPSRFVDAAAGDFRLAGDSRLIDRGTFLTTTRAEGVGATVPVQDASFFFDGYGIPGQVGDRIQFEGSSDTYLVVRVDRGANEVTLDRPAMWREGQGLSMAYAGRAPDIGAFEHLPPTDPEPPQ